jgi:hypothetical protein
MDITTRTLRMVKWVFVVAVGLWELQLLGIVVYVLSGHLSGVRPMKMGILPFLGIMGGAAFVGIAFYGFVALGLSYVTDRLDKIGYIGSPEESGNSIQVLKSDASENPEAQADETEADDESE